MAPVTQPHYKAPPAGVAEWLHTVTVEQDNEPPVNQRPHPEPDTVQTARPQPKSPPPGVPMTLQFQNLAGASEDSLTDIEEEASEDLSDAQSAATQPSGAHNTPSLDQQLGQEPDTSDAQHMPQSSSNAQQLPATTQPYNWWADMTDNDGGRVLAGDLMIQQVGQLRARPNTGIFASRRFRGNIRSEK